jgi:hypothetical protein
MSEVALASNKQVSFSTEAANLADNVQSFLVYAEGLRDRLGPFMDQPAIHPTDKESEKPVYPPAVHHLYEQNQGIRKGILILQDIQDRLAI